MNIYIYIYIERERERYTCVYIYIYIYIYVSKRRELAVYVRWPPDGVGTNVDSIEQVLRPADLGRKGILELMYIYIYIYICTYTYLSVL